MFVLKTVGWSFKSSDFHNRC